MPFRLLPAGGSRPQDLGGCRPLWSVVEPRDGSDAGAARRRIARPGRSASGRCHTRILLSTIAAGKTSQQTFTAQGVTVEQGLAELLKRLWPEALLALPDDVVSIGFWVLVAGFALLALVVMVKDGPRYRREPSPSHPRSGRPCCATRSNRVPMAQATRPRRVRTTSSSGSMNEPLAPARATARRPPCRLGSGTGIEPTAALEVEGGQQGCTLAQHGIGPGRLNLCIYTRSGTPRRASSTSWSA